MEQPVSDCAICIGVFTAPMIANCGHTFCASCLYGHMRSGNENARRCPICRVQIGHVNRNFAIDAEVDAVAEAHIHWLLENHGYRPPIAPVNVPAVMVVPGPQGLPGMPGPQGLAGRNAFEPINALFGGYSFQFGLGSGSIVEFQYTKITSPSITLENNAFTFTQPGVYLISFCFIVNIILGDYISFQFTNGTDSSNSHYVIGTDSQVCAGTLMMKVTTFEPFVLMNEKGNTGFNILPIPRTITITRVG